MKNHPDFDAAPKEHQWMGKLVTLAVRLRELAWKAKGAWVWYFLPGGALVGMRVNNEAEFRKELRIARRESLTDVAAAKKWMAEVAVFKKHLECEDWTEVELGGQKPGDSTYVILREPKPLTRVTQAVAE